MRECAYERVCVWSVCLSVHTRVCMCVLGQIKEMSFITIKCMIH